MSTPRTILLPVRFYDDHDSRELPTPVALKRTSRHVTVALNDPALPELLADALHYADKDGPGGGDPEYRGLKWSAAMTAAALEEAGIVPRDQELPVTED